VSVGPVVGSSDGSTVIGIVTSLSPRVAVSVASPAASASTRTRPVPWPAAMCDDGVAVERPGDLERARQRDVVEVERDQLDLGEAGQREHDVGQRGEVRQQEGVDQAEVVDRADRGVDQVDDLAVAGDREDGGVAGPRAR
jgi:hypothetical protein